MRNMPNIPRLRATLRRFKVRSLLRYARDKKD